MSDNIKDPSHSTTPDPPTIDEIDAARGQSNEGRRISTADVLLACVALFVLAVSLPLLDLLGRNAEFFLAHASSRLDIIALGLLLAVALPLLLGFAVAGIFKIDRTTGLVVLAIVIALLVALFTIRIIGATPASGLPAAAELVIASAVGILVAWAFFRFGTARSFIRFTAIAPIVVLGLFMFGSSASALVFETNDVSGPAQIAVDNPAQVVLIVFDEFPVASIMDEHGQIQDSVYPNFARLAEDATWFRNAVTVQQQTEHSLPAIVSGNDGSQNKLPTAGDYPFTLFTLLADSYDLHVYEAVTDLCPEYACENTTRPQRSWQQRWNALADDLWVVSGHLFLPDDMADGLPPIDSTWSNFSGGGGGSNNQAIIERFQELTYDSDRRYPIQEVVDLVGTQPDEPRLVFINALVPHVPWSYLPSGQEYNAPGAAPGTKSPGWGDDAWQVDQAYQMHLAQVGYADTILGQLIDNLEEAGTYDETLLVVMADHGVIVRPDTRHRRTVTEDTIGEIAAIPLFIKPPGEHDGGLDTYRAETIDVLPTIADVLGVDVPWSVAGTSLFSDDRPVRTQSQIHGSEGVVTFGVDGSEALAVAARKIEHFGADGPFGLAPVGFRDLLGESPADLESVPTAGATGTIRNESAYRDVDLDGPVIPAWTSGTLQALDEVDLVVAVVVNGRIAALTEARTDENGVTTYGAIVPPDAFVDGNNHIAIGIVRSVGDTWTFKPVVP